MPWMGKRPDFSGLFSCNAKWSLIHSRLLYKLSLLWYDGLKQKKDIYIMKKILLSVLGVLLVLFANATVVKITVDMKEKVCVIERFRNDGSLYSRHIMPMEIMTELKDKAMVNSKFIPKALGTMSTFGIGDTFNVVNDNSPPPYPNWRFMRYFSVNTGSNPIAFASIKICDALDTNSGNWLYYTTGMPIYNTDDSLLTDFGVWSPCVRYAYGVDLYLPGDTAKSPLQIVQITTCASVFNPAPIPENIVVFPNPSSDVVYAPALVGKEVQIVSIDGRLVYRGGMPENGVPVRGFSPGMYLIRSQGGAVRFVKN